MVFLYIAMFATVLGLTAVGGMFWAFRNGQMNDFRAGALSIFDQEEPMGDVTDRFPGHSDRRGGTREGSDNL